MSCGTHAWVSERKIFDSFPADQRMICRGCGEIRTVKMWSQTYDETFEEIQERFKKKRIKEKLAMVKEWRIKTAL